MKERICPECDAAFMPRYGHQVCCGDECREVRNKRLKRKCHARYRKAAAAARKEKAGLRAEFFAARDRAFERAGLPIPKIEVRDGVRIERRGYGFGSIY